MLLDHLKRQGAQEEDTGESHRQVVVNHMLMVQRALAGHKEYLIRLAQMRQTSPLGHNPSEPIPIKADDDG